MGLWRKIWILTSAQCRIQSASLQTCPDSMFAHMPNLPFVGYWVRGEANISKNSVPSYPIRHFVTWLYMHVCVRVCKLVWYIHSVSGQVSVSWVVTFVTCAVHHCLIHACSLVLASISCIHSLPVLNMLWKSSSDMEVPRYFAQERVVGTGCSQCVCGMCQWEQ